MVVKIIYRLSYWLSVAAMIALLAIVVLTTSDVTKRFILGSSLQGSVEVSEILLAVVAFLALAWAEISEKHVRMDFAFEHMPQRVQPWVNLFARLICVAALIFLLHPSISYAITKCIKGEVAWSGTGQIVLWPARFSVVFGFIFFLAVMLVKMVTDIRHLLHHKSEEI